MLLAFNDISQSLTFIGKKDDQNADIIKKTIRKIGGEITEFKNSSLGEPYGYFCCDNVSGIPIFLYETVPHYLMDNVCIFLDDSGNNDRLEDIVIVSREKERCICKVSNVDDYIAKIQTLQKQTSACTVLDFQKDINIPNCFAKPKTNLIKPISIVAIAFSAATTVGYYIFNAKNKQKNPKTLKNIQIERKKI